MTLQRYKILGVDVADASQQEVVQEVTTLVAKSAPALAVGVNAQVCNLAAANEQYRTLISRADVAYADGQSVVWSGRILGGKFPERCATTDLIYPLAEQAARQKWRIFFYGAAPGVAQQAADRLQTLYPDLQISTHHGYIRDDHQHQELIQQIHDYAPDLIFVGLGEPIQQEWLDRHQHELPPAVVLTCGGLFDWLSGAQARPPQWVVNAGLEWLWRLFLEPKRLWRRYVIGNPAFIMRFIGQLLRSPRQQPAQR